MNDPAMPRFQEPDLEPMTEQEKSDSSFMHWLQRIRAEGFRYRCVACKKKHKYRFGKFINVPCEECEEIDWEKW